MVVALAHVVRQIGSSDCEELGDGYLVQPINAITSFSYVVVGIAIAIAAWRLRRSVVQSLVYAVSLVGIGLGSVAFHGPQPSGSRIMHDLPIVFTLALVVVHDLGLLLPAVQRQWVPWFAGTSVAVIPIAYVVPDVAGVATIVLVVVAVVAEVLIHRRRLRPASARRQRLIEAIVVTVAIAAGATWLLGRTDSPACDPDGVLQFHAVWHVGSAIVFGLWWWLAFAADLPAEQERELEHAT